MACRHPARSARWHVGNLYAQLLVNPSIPRLRRRYEPKRHQRHYRNITSKKYMHPDLGIILAFDNVIERQKRIAERGQLVTPDTFESKETDFQVRVQEAYREIAKELHIPVIDAGRSIGSIQKQLMKMIEPLLEDS